MACSNCGACCVRYRITVPDYDNLPPVAIRDSDIPQIVWKEEGKPCNYLSYNKDSKTFQCSIHDIAKRPMMCQRFRCDDLPAQEKKELESLAKSLTTDFSK